MVRYSLSFFLLFLLAFPSLAGTGARTKSSTKDPGLASNVRQLTFAGRRAGEGYFSADGKKMIFQSERTDGNPFFQIYLMDLVTGDTRRLSNGVGRTTCSWLSPDGVHAMFSSTHEDPDAKKVQAEELARRKKGQPRMHSWVYDENFDIYQMDLKTKEMINLTHVKGYDAEGSYSPDGKKILFSSNRHAYAGRLSKKQAAAFKKHPEIALDLYIMNSDGSNPKRLTNVWGYDGGPFFCASNDKIVWRRFSPDGMRAEIYTMNADGTGKKQITHMKAMSWAPFCHPSGKYIIFTTNKHGFANFELYMVDVDGKHKPVRVTNRPGFDGLPVFTPDGNHLSWTSDQTINHQGQIFMADWDHQRAMELLGLAKHRKMAAIYGKIPLPRIPKVLIPKITPEDLYVYVRYLADPGLEGRLTGTKGEHDATAFVASKFKTWGLSPAGDNGTYFQEFSFVSGVSTDPSSTLDIVGLKGRGLKLERDWRPLAFSKTGKVNASEVAFVGYGIVAPGSEGKPEYDSYKKVDVRGKWAMMFRDLPRGLAQADRLRLSPFVSMGRKAAEAKSRGAVGIILVSGPKAHFRHDLVPLVFEGTAQDAGIAAVSMGKSAAARMLKKSRVSLAGLERRWRGLHPQKGFVLKGIEVGAKIDVTKKWSKGRNVLALLKSAPKEGAPLVMVGAHVDHIGHGEGLGSLARKNEQGKVHPGADDNASGVAVMMEMAQYLASLQAKGKLPAAKNIQFAAWSGEELGLLGSNHYVSELRKKNHGSIYPGISAYINMDMVGRLRDALILYGLETSPAWAQAIERANAPLGLPLVVQAESMLPTDATSFALAGVPVLSGFTKMHEEYNTPRDTADTLNYQGAARIGVLLSRVVEWLVRDEKPMVFTAPPKKKIQSMKNKGHGMRAYLGTVPDFAAADVVGVKLSGVRKDSPADKAGLKTGDVVKELAGKKIENLYDYSFAIGALEVGKKTKMVFERDGKRIVVQIVPGSRQ